MATKRPKTRKAYTDEEKQAFAKQYRIDNPVISTSATITVDDYPGEDGKPRFRVHIFKESPEQAPPTMATPKRPRDTNQWAKRIADIVAGEVEDREPHADKNAAAAELGRKGGKARAEVMTAKRRSEIARKAAKARWR
jgi:hypothetical protein